jgi:hypothetical protein
MRGCYRQLKMPRDGETVVGEFRLSCFLFGSESGARVWEWMWGTRVGVDVGHTALSTRCALKLFLMARLWVHSGNYPLLIPRFRHLDSIYLAHSNPYSLVILNPGCCDGGLSNWYSTHLEPGVMIL